MAFPLIGGSSGGFNPERSQQLIIDEVNQCAPAAEVVVVKWRA